MRLLLWRGDITVEHTAKIFQMHGFSPEDFQAFLTEASTPALEDAGLGNHLESFVAQSYATTWFSTEGLASTVRTCTGSIPGGPMADPLWNFTARAARVDPDL